MGLIVGLPCFIVTAFKREKRIDIKDCCVYSFSEYDIQITPKCSDLAGQSVR